jgi:hypothetical protein
VNKFTSPLALKGHGFSRAANNPQNDWASAPEGMQTQVQGLVESFLKGSNQSTRSDEEDKPLFLAATS